MKSTIISIFVCIFIIASGFQALGENENKEISIEEAMQYYCAEWINPDYATLTSSAELKVMKKDGTIEWFSKLHDPNPKSPLFRARFEINKGWIDKDGNTWLYLFYYFGTLPKKYTVAKISNNGHTLEQVYSYIAYPTEVTPDTNGYFIMYRKRLN